MKPLGAITAKITEQTLLKMILARVCRGPTRLFRNNQAQGWVGRSRRFDTPDTIRVQPGDVLIRNARPLHAGLHVGSGDLIGWKSVPVTPDMVGTTVAVFVSVEAKAGTTRTTPDQRNWATQVQAAGGIAGIVRSPEEAEGLLDQGRGRVAAE